MKASNVTLKLHWDEVLLAALREDIPWEDVSANAVVPEGARGHADLIAKAGGRRGRAREGQWDASLFLPCTPLQHVSPTA